MKISTKPMPKGRPASKGTIQGVSGLADHPSQKREMTNSGPPMQASGKRRYSSIEDHRALAFLARCRTPS